MGQVRSLRRARHGTLADRIVAARRRFIVGRHTEQEYFNVFLEPDCPQPIWWLIGPGGIGKTTLAHALLDRAEERGLPTAYLDARRIPPNPPEARHALEHAMGGRDMQAFCAAHEVGLLLIDTCEIWEPLHGWLRDEFLPEAPDRIRIVLCGRSGPDLQWRTDQGWQAVMHITELGTLAEPDCEEYLERRDIPETDRAPLIEFASGHPLALAMAADSARDGRAVHKGTDGGDDVISTLVTSFTREAQCDIQRQALDACAIVRELNEDLLARMLGRDDVVDVFEWLRGLTFVEAGGEGIYPHDLVREVLLRDMPRRAPGRYEAYARAAAEWFVDRIEAATTPTWAQATRMAADGVYVLRALPLVDQVFRARDTRALYLDNAGDADWDALHDMTLRHEGADSVHYFDYWRRRYPEWVYVIRNPQRSACGYFLKLDMEALSADECDKDPLTSALRAFLDNDLGLRPGEHVPFIRHWVTADYQRTGSPQKTQMLMAINAYNLMAKNLRATAQVFVDNPVWVALAQGLGIAPVPESETRIGDNIWRIYYLDWQRETPARYYRRFAQRVIGFQEAQSGQNVPEPAAHALARDAFIEAVESALKNLYAPARLADNPLLGSALVQQQVDKGADESIRIDTLREQIAASAEKLSHTGAPGARQYKVLHRAYLAPAKGQKAAAAALNMGYSTFRRQLKQARASLATELWHRELARR